MFPIAPFYLFQNEPNISLTVDGNTLLWSLLSGMLVIIGFFIVRHMNNSDKSLHELEERVDRGFEKFDDRLDSFERNQVRIMAKLGIDE